MASTSNAIYAYFLQISYCFRQNMSNFLMKAVRTQYFIFSSLSEENL